MNRRRLKLTIVCLPIGILLGSIPFLVSKSAEFQTGYYVGAMLALAVAFGFALFLRSR